MSTPNTIPASSDPHVFLIGRPPIGELLGFIRTMTTDGQRVDLASVTTEWRTANDHVLRLETTESGVADNPPVEALPDALREAAESLFADSMFRRAYQSVPTEIAQIDLDRLVVFQKFINLTYVEELKRRLGPSPSLASIFRFALPLTPDQPPFHIMQNSQNMYTLLSTSTDFRFLEAQILQPQSVTAFESTGRPVAILALGIGYGSNLLNALHVENRLVLSNGSHRAYALRDLGIRQIPCLIQRISRRDELELVAGGDFGANPDRYLKSSRPPMLRDYFDPALRKVFPVYRKNRVVRLQFGVEQSDIPV